LDGTTPIIAHPERSITEKKQAGKIEGLIRLGALMQINAGSLTGHFGKFPQKMAELLLKRNLAHLVASDAHDSFSRSVAVLPQAFRRVSQLVGKGRAEELFVHNPCRILKGGKLLGNDVEARGEDKIAQMQVWASSRHN
jgi:protein-tyrosine phosphatase